MNRVNGIRGIKVSADKAADALIYTGSCLFYGVQVVPAADMTFTIYDGIDNTGTAITPLAFAVLSTVTIFELYLPEPIYCATGIYLDVTTVGVIICKILYDY